MEQGEAEAEERGGTASLITLIAGLVIAVALWHEIRDGFAWWWDTATGVTSGTSIGELLLFAFGCVVAVIAATTALLALRGVFVGIGALGRAFADGWRHPRDPEESATGGPSQ